MSGTFASGNLVCLPDIQQRPCHFCFSFIFNALNKGRLAISGKRVPLSALERQSGKRVFAASSRHAGA
nr:hypothetical protein [Pseudomonas sp. A46]